VPDPILTADRREHQTFDDLYSLETTDKDSPYLTPNIERVKRCAAMVSAKGRATINCVECEKPRCLNAKSKLPKEEQKIVQRIWDENNFNMWFRLFQEDNPYHEQIDGFKGLTCGMQMETQYYSAVTVSFPDVCFHCGCPDVLEGEEVVRLKQQY
jgi:hypothetical protein